MAAPVFTLPPSTRAAGTPDPANDMDNVVKAITASGMTYSVMSSAYGTADPTGASDSYAAFQAAVNAAIAAGGGVVLVPAGTFLISTTISCNQYGVYIAAAGPSATFLNYTGTGDCIRMYWSGSYSGSTTIGGGVTGMTVNIAGGGGGATGVHMGDIENLKLADVVVVGSGQPFGVLLDNSHHWTERGEFSFEVIGCGAGLTLGGASGTGAMSTAKSSFKACRIRAKMTQNSASTPGFTFQYGARLYDGFSEITGNFTGSSGSVTTAAVTITGQVPGGLSEAGDYTAIQDCELRWTPECSSAAFTPQTIVFGSPGNNNIRGCRGIMDFRGGGNNFSPSNVTLGQASSTPGVMWFSGLIAGDANLSSAYSDTSNGNFPDIRTSTLLYAAGPSQVTSTQLKLWSFSGDIFFTNALTHDSTLVLASEGAGQTAGAPQRLTVVVQGGVNPHNLTLPTSGSPSVTTPNVVVVSGPGTGPTFAIPGGSTWKIELVTADGANWLATVTQTGSTPLLSLAAGDTSIVVGGTATAPTIETGTLDVIAADHPPAANWSNNSHKITSLANGSGAQDAAAFGQTPAGGTTVTIAQGGTGATAQQGALDAVAGAVTNNQVLAGNGTHVTLRALAAADLPAGTTGAKGAVQFDGTAADIQLAGTQAAGSNALAADSGHVHPTQLWLPGDNGILAATGDPEACRDTSVLIAGTVYLRKFQIRYGFTASKICVIVTGAGNNTGGSAGTFVGLYSSSGTLLSGSSDVAASLTSANFQALSLTTPQALSAGTFVWGAIVVNLGTTQPTLLTSVVQGVSGNANLGTSSLRSAINGTVQTSLPSPIVPGSNTTTNRINMWMGLD